MRNPKPFIFRPRNPQKYIGNANAIVCRSNLEFQFFKFFDAQSSIINWGSEEIIIPYICQLDQKQHRYFPDIFIVFKTKNGDIQKAICEIKPFAFCSPPPPSSKQTRSYVERAQDYVRNRNKWDAAKAFCESNHMKFIVLTEKDLKKMGT